MSSSAQPPATLRLVSSPTEAYLEEPTAFGPRLSGRNLTVVYSLRDRQGRSSFSVSGVSVVPVNVEESGLRTQLVPGHTCPTAGIETASGVGYCSVLLPESYFPSLPVATAQLQIGLELQVQN